MNAHIRAESEQTDPLAHVCTRLVITLNMVDQSYQAHNTHKGTNMAKVLSFYQRDEWHKARMRARGGMKLGKDTCKGTKSIREA